MVNKTILILPGWRGRLEYFDEVLMHLNYKTILIELPGFQKKLQQPWSLDDYIKFLKDFVDFAGLKNFILLGHSFGGALAVIFALKYPEMVEKLIIYNGAIVRKKNLKTKIIAFIAFFVKPFLKLIPNNLKEKLRYIFYRYIVRSLDYYLVDEVMKETFKNIQQDLSKEFQQLKVPTYLIWGTKDKITPWKEIQPLIKPEMKYYLIEGGHSLHREKPEEFAEIITRIVEDK